MPRCGALARCRAGQAAWWRRSTWRSWHDYYGPVSPLQRLCEAGGRVLRLGADDETVTALHYAEYLAEVPHKRRVRRYRKVTGPNGPQERVVECLDDCDGIVDWQGTDYFGLIVQAYRATGAGVTGRFGQARAEVFAAAGVVEFGQAWMETNLRAAAMWGSGRPTHMLPARLPSSTAPLLPIASASMPQPRQPWHPSVRIEVRGKASVGSTRAHQGRG